MSYDVDVDDRAVRELLRLPKIVVRRIGEAIAQLTRDPRPPGAKKLSGRGGYRLRVGDCRILYEIDDKARKVLVFVLGHRKDIYR